ncbi:MAG: flagellar hook protein FlgE [Sulfurimicrobium sp.]|nr:flagellar hook protein FlgE [Sulfurimicrobium sp.]
MGFQTGLSGLNASSKNLDVIGHNVANSATVGFKASQAQFADVFAASLSGGGGAQVGIGTRLASVAQQFTQGNISATNNPLDMAINGRGFFRLSDNGAISYTRNGQFQLDKDNNIVTSSGINLTGYQADSAGTVTGALGNIQLNTADIDPSITNTISIGANLDSRMTAPTAPLVAGTLTGVAPNFNAPNPASYNSSTSLSVYDSLGNSHIATFYFVKAPAPAANTWDVLMTVDNGVNDGGEIRTVTSLVFDATGKLTAPLGPPLGYVPSAATNDIAWPAAMGVTTPQLLNYDFAGSTQFGSSFGVNALSQDGFTSGRMAGFSIGSDGTVQGRYTNGQTRTLGQVALANFATPQGLQQMGDNQWTESSSSGAAVVGAPGTASLGVLQASSTEDSNTDLTAELVNMIVAQRAYQANAQTIKTQDAIQQTLMNLR